MIRRLYIVCAAVATLLTAASAETDAVVPAEVQTAFEHYVALPKALLPVLTSAKDAATAEAAAPALHDLLPRVYDARREINAISSLPPNVAEAVRLRYEKQMRAEWGKVYEQIYRLQRVRCYENVPFFKQFSTLCVLLGQQ